ncbi:hypothetical protein [Novosphingobium rosa]|uniref:hypothetical protein n=1 Tax=Novosphingobium rosa TaxID=76978 RepID=UPI00082F6341|nr:hypothetical protein [Novosphingobium rosa]
MTKQRDPLTPYRALCRIEEVLGWDGIATIISKNVWHCRKMSDPDTGRELCLQDAIRLDAAFQRAGGVGFPLMEAHFAQLVLTTDPGVAAPLTGALTKAVKENAEGIAAALALVEDASDPKVRRKAIKEVEESIEASLSLLFHIKHGVSQ